MIPNAFYSSDDRDAISIGLLGHIWVKFIDEIRIIDAMPMDHDIPT